MRDAGHQTIPKEATLSRRSLWPLVRRLIFSETQNESGQYRSACGGSEPLNRKSACSLYLNHGKWLRPVTSRNRKQPERLTISFLEHRTLDLNHGLRFFAERYKLRDAGERIRPKERMFFPAFSVAPGSAPGFLKMSTARRTKGRAGTYS